LVDGLKISPVPAGRLSALTNHAVAPQKNRDQEILPQVEQKGLHGDARTRGGLCLPLPRR